MTFTHWLVIPFKFSAINVSALLLVTYAVLFGAVLHTDQTPDVPQDQGGLNLQQAYEDLHIVSSQ